jgi:hypothetical protein
MRKLPLFVFVLASHACVARRNNSAKSSEKQVKIAVLASGILRTQQKTPLLGGVFEEVLG